MCWGELKQNGDTSPSPPSQGHWHMDFRGASHIRVSLQWSTSSTEMGNQESTAHFLQLVKHTDKTKWGDSDRNKMDSLPNLTPPHPVPASFQHSDAKSPHCHDFGHLSPKHISVTPTNNVDLGFSAEMVAKSCLLPMPGRGPGRPVCAHSIKPLSHERMSAAGETRQDLIRVLLSSSSNA